MKELILLVAFVTLVSISIGFLFGFGAGLGTGTSMTRKDAIEHRAGRWTIDPQTGEKAFQWTPKE